MLSRAPVQMVTGFSNRHEGKAIRSELGCKVGNSTSSVFSMSTTLIFHSDCIIAADWSSRYCAAASALPVTYAMANGA
jgi:hypothetical protein